MADDKEKWMELVRPLITAGLIGIVSATIKALMSKNENLPSLIRTFFAGVLLSILVGYILHTSTLSEMWKTIIIAASAAFISTFWPLLERIVKNYVNKKGRDVVNNTGSD